MSKPKPLVWLMLDSGAFSAWNSGVEIDINAYIAFIHEHKHLIQQYVNLDVIPGKRGTPRTQQDVERSAEQGYKNLKYMHSKGLKPIPVFHQGERWYWLKKMMDEGEDYIGISPMADLPSPVVKRWMDEAFTITTNAKGEPLIRTHGFGVTSFKVLFRYPWTTCDSATWALIGAYGRIIIPQRVDGKPAYDLQPLSVRVSGVQGKAGGRNELQFESMGPILQKYITEWIESCGVSIYEARNDAQSRSRVVCTYFMRLSEFRSKNTVFRHRKNQLT